MKKVFFLISMLLLANITLTFAQLQEVKGIETRYVGEYMEFTNMNKYSVSIDVEIWRKPESYEGLQEHIVATKSFILESRGAYILKYESSILHGQYNKSDYIIKYKAFKFNNKPFVSAQLQEVNGIETKFEEYEGNQYTKSTLGGGTYSTNYRGIKFTNMNEYSVSIDMELWRSPYYAVSNTKYNEELITTKSFILEAGESYLLKSDYFCTEYYCTGVWSYTQDYDCKLYFVKFKAFKNE